MPIVWIASATTMDYVWSLAFLIGSFLAGSAGRPLWAGILVGLAAGFRPAHAALLAVPFMLLPLRGRDLRALATMIAGCTGILALAFLPVWVSYGFSPWLRETIRQVGGVKESLGMHAALALYRGVYTIGPVAALSMVAVAIVQRRRIRRNLESGDPLLIASLAGLCIVTLSFLLLPAERSYLIPAIPFALVIVDRIASRGALVLVGFALATFAVANPDAVHHRGLHGTPGFNLRHGILADESERRSAIRQKRSSLSSAGLVDSAVIMVGAAVPLWVENPDFTLCADDDWETDRQEAGQDLNDRVARRVDRSALFVTSTLTRDQIERVRAMGLSVFCFDDAGEYVEFAEGYRPEDAGVVRIHAKGIARP